MPHVNNKETKIQTQSLADRITTSLNLAHQRKNKQKLRTNLTLKEAYTTHWTNLRRAETKRKKEFNLEAWEKETSSHNKLKIMKMQRNTTQMKEQIKNTEFQVNKEEISKPPEKEFRIVMVNIIKKP